MPESTVLFPISPQQPAARLVGQIFAIPSLVATHTKEPLEYLVQDGDLTLRQKQSLEALTVFHQATADLLLRYLRLSPNSLRHLQKQLAVLHPQEEKERYLEYIIPPKPQSSRFGSSPYVYTLGRRGHRYLKKQGFPVGRYRVPGEGVQEEIPLRHRLAVNEFLLKALLLETEETPEVQNTQVSLQEFRHEKYWNANPLRVLTPDAEKPQGLSPDLLLAFTTQRPVDEFYLLPEINLTEPWRKDWEAKVRLYRYCMPAYRERLGTSILTTIPVMVASPSAFPRRVQKTLSPAEEKERVLEAKRREKRLHNLRNWTEGMLDRMNMTHEADLFSFSAAPLDELTPTELFFGTHWINPFSDTPHSLLPAGKDGSN